MQKFNQIFFILGVFSLLLNPLTGKSKVFQYRFTFRAYHTFKEINGTIKKAMIEPIQWKKQEDTFQIQPFRIIIQLTDLDTGDNNRDSHMLEVLGYPIHKTIQVEVISLQKWKNNIYQVRGFVYIKAIKKPFISYAEIQEGNTMITAKGKFRILLSDFQIEPPSLLFIKVKNHVDCFYFLQLSI